MLEGFDCHLDVMETRFEGHARELGRELDVAAYDGLVVIGGDGTMHEVVNGILARPDGMQLPIGLIAGGSGNSFARDLGMLNPRDAADAIARGRWRRVDVAEVTSGQAAIYTVSIVGWGLVTDIGVRAEALRWWGTTRYTVASIWEVCRAQPRRARMLLDGREFADDFVFVVACNTRFTGKGMKIAPHAKIDDGLLDIVVVRWAPTRLKMLSLISRVYDGTYVDSPYVEYYSVSEMVLLPDRDEELNVDGQLTGATPIRVQVKAGAITVYALGQG
jgi:YegS/Rv2252/BmrU family lipid kinase